MLDQVVRLWPVVALLAAGGVLWVLVRLREIKQKSGPRVEAERLKPDDARSEGPPPVVGRKWLLDHGSEARFFGVLEAAAGAGCRVMVQVPLCLLVEVEKGLAAGKRQTWQNKIDRKTVDFVVCDAGTLRPRIAVELDGSSHDGAKRRERDELVETVLAKAGVRLVRFDRRDGKEWGVEGVRGRLAQQSIEKEVEAC